MAGALEPVQDLFGDRIGVQSGAVDASDAPHEPVPMRSRGVQSSDFTPPFRTSAWCDPEKILNRSLERADRTQEDPRKQDISCDRSGSPDKRFRSAPKQGEHGKA